MSMKLWPFRPDWSNGILERLTWRSDVMASTSGAEQRRPQRLTPRRELEASFLVHERLRSIFDQYVLRHGAEDWFIPLWYDVDKLERALPAAATIAKVAWENREFTAGGFAVIRPVTSAQYDKASLEYEIVKLVKIQEAEVVIVRGQQGTVARDWPVGAEVYPIRQGRFVSQPSTTVVTANTSSTNMSFLVTEPNEWDGTQDPSGYGMKYGYAYGRTINLHPMVPAKNLGKVADPAFLPVFEGFRVLNVQPDYNQDLTYSYDRLTEQLDNESGIPRLLDMAGFATPVQKHTWFLHGRAEHASFRTLLYFLRGKVRPIWLPTFGDDVQLIAPTPAGQLWMDIADIGYTEAGVPVTRQCLAIQMTNGTWFFRRIVGSAVVAGGERLELSEAFPLTLLPQQIYKISFMAVSRLEQDVVELDHQTDSAGLTRAVVTFRNVPDLRQYIPWQLARPPELRGCDDSCATMPRTEDLTNFGIPGSLWSESDMYSALLYSYKFFALGNSQRYLLEPNEPIQIEELEDYLGWAINLGIGSGNWVYNPELWEAFCAADFAAWKTLSRAEMELFLSTIFDPDQMEAVYGYSDSELRAFFFFSRVVLQYQTYVQMVSEFQTKHARNWLPFAALEATPETCITGALGRFCVQSTYHRDGAWKYPTNARGATSAYAGGVWHAVQGLDEENWPTAWVGSREWDDPMSILQLSHSYITTQVTGNGLHSSCGCIPLIFNEQHAGTREAVHGRDPRWVHWWHRAYAAWLTKKPWPNEIRLFLYDSLTGGLIRTIDLDVINIPVSGWADQYTRPANFHETPRPYPKTYSANMVLFRKSYGRESVVITDDDTFHQDPWVDQWNLVPLNSKGFVIEVYPR